MQTWTRAGARPLYLLNLQLRNFIMKAQRFCFPFSSYDRFFYAEKCYNRRLGLFRIYEPSQSATLVSVQVPRCHVSRLFLCMRNTKQIGKVSFPKTISFDSSVLDNDFESSGWIVDAQRSSLLTWKFSI